MKKNKESADLKIDTPVGSFEAQSNDEDMRIKFSAYGIVDFETALVKPKFDDPNSLKNKAIEAGKLNKPPADSKTLSSDELSIFHMAKDAVGSSQEKIRNIIAKYREDIIRLETRLSTPYDPAHVNLHASQKAANIRANYKQKIKDQYEEYSLKLRDLRYFQNLHNRTMPAKYPLVHSKTMSIFIIILVLETILNGALFREVMLDGFVGGWLTALLVSAFNICVGFFIGNYLIRMLNGRDNNKRIFAGSLTFVFSIFMLIFFVYIAQYRDLLGNGISIDESGTPSLLSLSLEDALSKLINFNYWESYVFLVANLLIFIFSIFKGLYLDDSYPEYGDVDRAFKREKIKYLALKTELFDNVKGLVFNNKHKIFLMQNEYRKWLHAYYEIPKLVEGHIELYKLYLESIDMQCESLLKRYREYNKDIRTEPVPEYFNEFNSVIPNSDVANIDIKQELYEDAKIKLSELEKKSKDIIENFDSAISQDVKAFEEFISNIEVGVDNKLSEDHKTTLNNLKDSLDATNEFKIS